MQPSLPHRRVAGAAPREFPIMTKRTLVATAAALFAAGTLATSAHAQTAKCSGVNACKGTSACKSANSACKGQNACKGQGWTEAATAAECTGKGGKVM
jgi:hypothetical protein